MKRFLRRAKPQRSLLVASAFGPVCLGMLMLGSATRPKPQSPPRSDVKIINKTTTLEMVAFKNSVDGHLIIRFKNISAKNLNGYVLMVNGVRITGDISSGDRVVASGQTEDLEIPMPPTLPELIVVAAMFADGSIEGDAAVAGELRQWRLTVKKQLTRSLSFLDATLESPEVDTVKALDKLESQLSFLQPDSAAESQKAGDTLRTEIQMLREKRQRHGSHTQRQDLLDLKSRIERRIARL